MPSNEIVYNSAKIFFYSNLHRILKGGNLVLRAKFWQEWEMACRYRKYCLLFGESDSDIYISAYHRSGQTWMQMILYQLTTDGNMDFEHLYEVSPWLYYCAVRERPIPQVPAPRIIKTHDHYHYFSRNTRGRFIYVWRDGRDVMISRYHAFKNFYEYQGSFDDHFDWFINSKIDPKGFKKYLWQEYNWFDHVQEWMINEYHFPILYIRYEDLKNNLDKCIAKIIDFCDLNVSQEVIERTKKRCDFSFMKEHESKFKPKRHSDRGSFIRQGEIGENKELLTPEQQEIYLQRFQKSLKGIIEHNYEQEP